MLDARRRASRDVVRDDRELRRIGDVLEMCDQAALGWLVVVRGYHEDAVRARVFGCLREREGLGRRVRARAADQLALASDRVANGPEEIGLLLVRDRR